MRIFITTPTFGLNGGIRNIVELANGLHELRHDVILFNESGHLRSPYEIKCRVANATNMLKKSDVLVLGSPHSVRLLEYGVPSIAWVQMLEEKFRPGSQKWYNDCQRWYYDTNLAFFSATWGANGTKPGSPVLGTWVNLDHFPISTKPKDGKTILLESPEPNNPAKDVDFKALKAAQKLKADGYKIIAYGANPLKSEFKSVPDEYYAAPTLAKMNELYERATILLKATRYDFRSVSCLEAMTKGCVSVRSIIEGDEDLTPDLAYKTHYDEDIYELAQQALNDPNLSQKANNCRYFIQEKNKDYWLPKYQEVICG